jgi:hypothetical protein
MNIVHIVPGSGGGFYCQNCVRDIGLVKALQAAGHDVLFMPMYLPFLELTDSAVAQSPVFFGAVNTWLQLYAAGRGHVAGRAPPGLSRTLLGVRQGTESFGRQVPSGQRHLFRNHAVPPGPGGVPV